MFPQCFMQFVVLLLALRKNLKLHPHLRVQSNPSCFSIQDTFSRFIWFISAPVIFWNMAHFYKMNIINIWLWYDKAQICRMRFLRAMSHKLGYYLKQFFCFAKYAKIAVNFSLLWKLLWISSLPYKGISTYKLNLLQKETIFLQRIFLGFFRDPLNSICFLEIGTLWKKHLILKKLKLLFFLFKYYTDWKALLLFF